MSADASSFQPTPPGSWPRLAPASAEGAPIGFGAGTPGGARPALRLVGGKTGVGEAGGAAARAALDARRRAVERENRAASVMDPEDAREIVAGRVGELLEGGRAAVLRPESRRRVMALATRLGLRPFDANLIIAIVQDGARRGVRDSETKAMLRLIEEPAGRGGVALQRWALAARMVSAVLLAVLLAGAMAAWVIGVL